MIDFSWIPHVEAVIKWYDKTITEFPGTTASRIAYIPSALVRRFCGRLSRAARHKNITNGDFIVL